MLGRFILKMLRQRRGELGAGEALGPTYDDTISDLALSTTGGLIGALLGVRFFAARHDGAHNHPHH